MIDTTAIGIDIGGTRLKAALVSSDGVISEKRVEQSRMRDAYPALRDQIIHVVRELSDVAGFKPAHVGIGVAGLVDAARRRVLAAPNCPGVVNQPLTDDLEQATGVRCLMDNDANVMALGERFIGAAQGCDDLVAVTLGTGVGGAIISGGRLIRGHTGGGGEIGHVCIDRNGPRCGCGSNGCLEAFVGMGGIFRWVSRNQPDLKGMGIAHMIDLGNEGNQSVAAVFKYVGRTLAVGLAGMVNVFNPAVLLIGGGVASAGDLLIKPLREELHKRAFEVYLTGIEVRPAALGNWAGVVGAARLEKE